MKNLKKGRIPEFVTIDTEDKPGNYTLLVSFIDRYISVDLITKKVIVDIEVNNKNYWGLNHIENIIDYHYTEKVLPTKIIPEKLYKLSFSKNKDNTILAGNMLLQMYKKEIKEFIIKIYNIDE